MPDYRRNLIPGGTYFFTVNLQNRSSRLLVDEIDLLRSSVRRVRQLTPFHMDAWVVLPNHMHTLWTLPPGDANYSRRWQAIKMPFAKGVVLGEPTSSNQKARGERAIWQRRYWEHTIRDARDYAAHMDYIHFNPVKHGLASQVADWPYSSFHTCVERGLYPSTWAVQTEPPGRWGERTEVECEEHSTLHQP